MLGMTWVTWYLLQPPSPPGAGHALLQPAQQRASLWKERVPSSRLPPACTGTPKTAKPAGLIHQGCEAGHLATLPARLPSSHYSTSCEPSKQPLVSLFSVCLVFGVNIFNNETIFRVVLDSQRD